ncbi:MAG: hypothetical protein CMQ19_07410 [Gammaproteobacteria bacterium]|nr:hypothetical protein [Gammaproteobacteria bacterium]
MEIKTQTLLKYENLYLEKWDCHRLAAHLQELACSVSSFGQKLTIIRTASMVTLILLCLMDSVRLAAEPIPFRAVYKADYKGLPVSAVGIRELKRIENGKYQLSSTAQSFFVSVFEKSIFELHDQYPLPLEYDYKRTGIGKNRDTTLTFDRQTGKVVSEQGEWEIEATKGILDKLSYQYRMREDLKHALKKGQSWPDLNYQVADNGRIKTYNFEITGEEFIDTPVGRIKTVKAIRIRKNGGRSTTFWLAPDYEFLLIRLLQTEKDGKGFELLLKEAQFGSQQVQGLE